MTIQNELNKIKSAVLGKDVRTAIHDSIEKTYNDATESGNANMEVEMARGTHLNLNDRLNVTDNKINVTDNKINNTKTTLDTRIDNIIATPTTVSEQEIIDARQNKASLGANLTTIKQDLVAHKEDYMDTIVKSPNLFNKQSVTLGYMFNGSNGELIANPLYFISDFIEVVKFENYNRSHNMMVVRYNENLDFTSVVGFNNTPVASGGSAYVRLAGYIDDISDIQFEKGNVATQYREYDKILIDKLSISSTNLNEDLTNSITLDMENILNNGTFIEGISDWMSITTPGSFTTVNGMVELDMMHNHNPNNGILQPVELIKGDKYYVITRAKTDDTIATIQLRAYTTTIDSRVSTGEFEIFSGVVDAENQSDIRVRVVYPSVEDANDKKLTIDYVSLINLSELYGRGNEPSKDKMEGLIIEAGGFDGKYIFSQKQIFHTLISEIRTKGNQDTKQGVGYIVNPDLSEYTGQAMITLSYDDGYLNNHFLALPIHEKHGIPATFNIPANRPITESYHDRFFNSLIVRECHERGVEIASHAYKHGKYTEQSDEDIHWDMAESIRVLDLITGVPTETIAIPNSDYDSRVENIAKQYFKGVRVYGNELNDLPVNNRYHLKSIIAITNTTTLTQVKNIIDDVIVNKKWAILMFHNIKNASLIDRTLYATTPQFLDETLSYINEQGRDILLPVNTRDGLKFSLGENY